MIVRRGNLGEDRLCGDTVKGVVDGNLLAARRDGSTTDKNNSRASVSAVFLR
jgi:hypothetical protein